MRKLVLALAPALLLLALPATASATGDDPAIKVGPASFELFGTSFCYGSVSSVCDVTLLTEPQLATAVQTPPADGQHATTILGVRICSRVEKTGPACDITWVLPFAAQAWRDWPEMRMLADLDR